MTLNETDYQRLLDAGDLPGLLDDPQVQVALDGLTVEYLVLGSSELPTQRGAEILPRERKGRRHRKAVVATAVILAVGLPLSAAAAIKGGLHTGIWTSDDGRPAAELLNLNVPEVVGHMRSFESKYPLPPGGTYAALEKRWPRSDVGFGHGVVVEQAVEFEAGCQWTLAWLEAHRSGDSGAAQGAVQVLRARPDLPIVRSYDADGGEFLRQLADEVAAGIPDTAQSYVTANCVADTVVGN